MAGKTLWFVNMCHTWVPRREMLIMQQYTNLCFTLHYFTFLILNWNI